MLLDKSKWTEKIFHVKLKLELKRKVFIGDIGQNLDDYFNIII